MSQFSRTFTNSLAASAAVTALLLADGMRAQDDADKAADASANKPVPQVVAIDAMLGAPVTNSLTEEGAQTIGRIRDAVFDTESGELRFVVLRVDGAAAEDTEAGERDVAAPAEQLSFGAKGWSLPMTPEQAVALPDFDPQKLHLLNEGGMAAAATSDAKKDGDAGQSNFGKLVDDEPATPLMIVSAIAKAEVRVGEETVGNAPKLYVAPKGREIAFAGVSVTNDAAGAGDPVADPDTAAESLQVLVPWSVVKTAWSPKSKVHRLAIQAEPEQWQNAPRIDATKMAIDERVRAAIYEHFGAKAPKWDASGVAGSPGR